jgi:plasmid stabilization system protein ParE
MATAIRLDSAAREEFDEAFDWYAKRSTGAAIGFASEIDAAIEKVAADPGRFPKPSRTAKRAPSNDILILWSSIAMTTRL